MKPVTYSAGITFTAALVLSASFMPWGEIMNMTMTGWNGSITIGMKLPNWLVVFAAAASTALAWLKTQSIWMAHMAIPIAFCVYGLFHSCAAIIILMGADKGTPGIGAFLTVAAFVGMLVLVVKEIRAKEETNELIA